MTPMTLPAARLADPLWGRLREAPSLPAVAVREARDEAVRIWQEARMLSGHGNGNVPAVGQMSTGTVYFAWYGGLVAMAMLRVIEWRLAAILAALHTVEHYAHRRRVQEFLEGVSAGV
jgi:hypothetical protein